MSAPAARLLRHSPVFVCAVCGGNAALAKGRGAKTRLTALLAEVEAGETIEITRHGKPVARLTPIGTPKRDVAATIARLRELRKGVRLDGLSIKDLINDGRKY